MHVLLSLSMAIAPALVLVRYFYLQDKKKPEPKDLILKIFLLGIASIIPVLILESIVSFFQIFLRWSPTLYYFFEAFLVAGVCEEFIKLRVVQKYAYNTVHFDEVMDGIVYTVVASLGFACMENVIYVMRFGLNTALTRAFTSVPMHAVCSGIMGYYIGKAKFSPNSDQDSLFIKGFGVAVGLHGLYDFVIFISPFWGAIFSVLVFPIIIWSFIRLKDKIRLAIQDDIDAGRV